jgi:acyl carrier protein
MAARLDESLRQRIAATGLRMISPARGRWALTKLLEDPSAPGQVGVFNGNWSVVRSSGPLASALLADAPTADDGTSVAQAGAKGSFIEALEHAGPHQRGDVVSKHVASQVARALGYPPDRELDAGVGFFDLGMDSLRAVDLRNALQKTTGLALRGMVAFEHPTIRALSQHILMQLADGAPPARRPPNASAAS